MNDINTRRTVPEMPANPGAFARPSSIYAYSDLIRKLDDGNNTEDSWAAAYYMARGVHPLVLAARGVRLLPTQSDWRLSPNSQPFNTHPEFEQLWKSPRIAPIGIPLWTPRNARGPVCIQLRPENPFVKASDEPELDAKGRMVKVVGGTAGAVKMKMDSIKFIAPTGAKRGTEPGDLPADVHPWAARYVDDNTVPMILTEGQAKADSILSASLHEGILVMPVAVTGVTMGYVADANPVDPKRRHELAETIADINVYERRVYLCWDADWRTNGMVKASLLRTAELLEEAAADVRIIDVPAVAGKGTGVDDYLGMKETTLADLLADAEGMTIERATRETKKYAHNDIGRGQRLADEMRANPSFLFNQSDEKRHFLRWNKCIWEVDRATSIRALAAKLAPRDPEDEDRASSIIALNAAIKLAESLDTNLSITEDELDADGSLLNAQNGTVDLRTGIVRPHNPADRMSKITAVPCIAGPHPVFDKFLLHAMGGDVTAVEYIQQMVGMILVGKVDEELLHYFFGPGHSGKSTLLDFLRDILSVYARKVNPHIVLGEGSSEELERVRGIRFAYGAEMKAGKFIDEGALKDTVSRGNVEARALYKDRVEWAASHSFIFAVNTLPILAARDTGTTRRLRVIPWDHVVTRDEVISNLDAKLMAEAPAVLAWMVEGAVKYIANGHKLDKAYAACDMIREATERYTGGGDQLAEFVQLFFAIEPGATVKRGTAYLEYQLWCAEKNLKPFSQPSLVIALQERGVLPKVKAEKAVNGVYFWNGIRLRERISGHSSAWSEAEIARAAEAKAIAGVGATHPGGIFDPLAMINAQKKKAEAAASEVPFDPFAAIAAHTATAAKTDLEIIEAIAVVPVWTGTVDVEPETVGRDWIDKLEFS